jgi:hypothetical protein
MSFTELGNPFYFLEGEDLFEAVPEVFKRPEWAILVFVLALLTYLTLLTDAPPDQLLSSRQLARRLGVEQKILRRKKYQPDFGAWTQNLDPDGIAWTYQHGAYLPL